MFTIGHTRNGAGRDRVALCGNVAPQPPRWRCRRREAVQATRHKALNEIVAAAFERAKAAI